MLAFFRRVLSSWVVVALLAVLMIAFIVTGVGTPGGLGGLTGPGADAVATVDGAAVPTADVARQAQNQLAQARQQQADLTMPAFLRAVGGVGPLVDNYLAGRTLEAWASRNGFVASDKLIDGEIAGIAAFQGPAGKFDEAQMRTLLAQQRLSEGAFRESVRADLLRRQLLVPLSLGAQAPASLANAYAGLFISRREGLAGFVPSKPDAVPAPDEATLAAWYKTNALRYALPERRVIRYALLNPSLVPVAAPTDGEIAARYQADAAQYAARETRSLSQVVLPNEDAAKALAAKVAGGTAFAVAAQQAGFAAGDIALGEVKKPDLARTASPAIADAAFAAKAGETTAPLKSPLGWHVVHVDKVTDVAARPLATVRGEIGEALLKQKRIEAVSALGQKIQDAIDGGATFADVTRDHKLTVVTTPPVLASGLAPGDPAFKPDATLTALLRPAFLGSPEDDATLEQVGPDQQFALLSLASIVPAAPVPLAQVRERAIADYRAERADAAARTAAQAILDKLRLGQSLAGTFAASGLAAPQPLGGSQLELAQLQQQRQPVPPVLRVLFALAPGKAQIARGPGGWFVVQLAGIRPGPPQLLGSIAAGLRAQFGREIGQELLEQFARATQAETRIKRNPTAIAALARQLNGEAPAAGGQ